MSNDKKEIRASVKAEKERGEIEYLTRRFLDEIIEQTYSARVFDLIKDDVVEDVNTSADEEWGLGDVKLAIGRTLCKRLGLEY